MKGVVSAIEDALGPRAPRGERLDHNRNGRLHPQQTLPRQGAGVEEYSNDEAKQFVSDCLADEAEGRVEVVDGTLVFGPRSWATGLREQHFAVAPDDGGEPVPLLGGGPFAAGRVRAYVAPRSRLAVSLEPLPQPDEQRVAATRKLMLDIQGLDESDLERNRAGYWSPRQLATLRIHYLAVAGGCLGLVPVTGVIFAVLLSAGTFDRLPPALVYGGIAALEVILLGLAGLIVWAMRRLGRQGAPYVVEGPYRYVRIDSQRGRNEVGGHAVGIAPRALLSLITEGTRLRAYCARVGARAFAVELAERPVPTYRS